MNWTHWVYVNMFTSNNKIHFEYTSFRRRQGFFFMNVHKKENDVRKSKNYKGHKTWNSIHFSTLFQFERDLMLKMWRKLALSSIFFNRYFCNLEQQQQSYTPKIESFLWWNDFKAIIIIQSFTSIRRITFIRERVFKLTKIQW